METITPGTGSLGATYFGLNGNVSEKPRLPLSSATLKMIKELDFLHSGYVNPKYQPDPSLWTNAFCGRFNVGIEHLLPLLKKELGPDCRIVDRQLRKFEDPRLTDCLKVNPELSAMTTVPKKCDK